MNIKDLQDYVREIVSDSDDTCECTAHLYLLLEEKGNGSKYGMYLSEFKDDGTDIYVLNFSKFRTKTSKILPKIFLRARRDSFDSTSKADSHLSFATLQLMMPCASAITPVTGYQFVLV